MGHIAGLSALFEIGAGALRVGKIVTLHPKSGKISSNLQILSTANLVYTCNVKNGESKLCFNLTLYDVIYSCKYRIFSLLSNRVWYLPLGCVEFDNLEILMNNWEKGNELHLEWSRISAPNHSDRGPCLGTLCLKVIHHHTQGHTASTQAINAWTHKDVSLS